jgi:hypothetical protein
VSTYAFPFQNSEPVVTLTLVTPDLTLPSPPMVRETLRVDTGQVLLGHVAPQGQAALL